MSIVTDHVTGLFRTEWATRFVDTCDIVARSQGALNTTTGEYTPTEVVHYSGACLARPMSPGSTEVGEEQIEQRDYLVVIPWDKVAVEIDDIVKMTSTFDGVLNGKELVVRNIRADTYNTARKLLCEDNQGG
jgi:hypothetical protein